MKRVNLYIDGYNFYCAIKNAAKEPEEYDGKIDDRMYIGYAWCNFKKLVEEQLLNDDEELNKIVYCTAKIEDHETEIYPGEKKNQQLWLDYLEEYIPNELLTIKLGRHRKYNQNRPTKKEEKNILKKLRDMIDDVLNPDTDTKKLTKKFRDHLDRINPQREEKMTDVNMAVEMVKDGLCENMEVAILITEDADFLPAVEALCEKPMDVRVYIPIPKKRNLWDDLKKDYKLTNLTTDKLTANWLARSALPYKKRGNKEPCGVEKILLRSTREEIYEKSNRYWTYEAIRESMREVHKFSVDAGGTVCNVTTSEKKRLKEDAGWKQFNKQKISVYNYLEKEYKS